MLKNGLKCIVVLVVLVGFSFADEPIGIRGNIMQDDEYITGATVYARCDETPCHQVDGYCAGYTYSVGYYGSPHIQTTHAGYWKVKGYKADVGVSGWSQYYELTPTGSYYHDIELIPLPKK